MSDKADNPPTFRWSRSDDGIVHVLIDQPGRSVNAFSIRVLNELDSLIAGIERDRGAKGVLFTSAKPGSFVVGADVHAFTAIASPADARRFSELGQRVFSRLERLTIPTVALISGTCLGGGLEFALACRHRLADDDPRTTLGLPEVRLGLVPGWGGTVRLPRRVGLPRAIRMITTGESVSARQARSMGLVEDVVPPEALLVAGRRWIEAPPSPPRRPWLRRLREGLVELGPMRSIVGAQAKRAVRRQTHGHYKAPERAIDLVCAGKGQDASAALAAEASAIAELASHPVTTELVRLFLLREQAKPWARSALGGEPTNMAIDSAAVVGAGVMGAGIVGLLAERGIEARWLDLEPKYLARGLATIRSRLADRVNRRRLRPRDADAILARISPSTTYTGLAHVAIAIEAVVEDVAVKHAVFRELERACGPRTVLASNTSSIALAALSPVLADPGRLIGAHFFNPVSRMPLVEVVRTDASRVDSLAVGIELSRKAGKTPIVVRDGVGFLVNRVVACFLNEAGFLLEEVANPMDIERSAIAFGFPMGPLELVDLVGSAVSNKVALHLHEAFGERMRPAPFWERMAEASSRDPKARLIQKRWLRKPRLDPRADAVRRGVGTRFTPMDAETIARRMVFAMVNEAARCLEEKRVEHADQIDLAMVFGTGFAPFRGGPIRYANAVGIDRVVAGLTEWSRTRPRLAPCALLVEMARAGAKFPSTLLDAPTAGNGDGSAV